MEDKVYLDKLSSNYLINIIKAFNNDTTCTDAVQVIAKSLKDLYRFFEPAFFTGNFFLIKNFRDELLFPKEEGELFWDKSMLINKTTGDFSIQVLDSGEAWIWHAPNVAKLYEATDTLSYHFINHCDSYVANGQEIFVPSEGKGSYYAPYFINLLKALNAYKTEKVFRSTCATFRKSWYDPNYIAFVGEGSGNNIPEKYIQESLHDFLRTQESLRGIGFETTREHNFNSDKPKPVDIRMLWREANRHALIEIKYTGLVKNKTSGNSRMHPDQSTFDDGYKQVNGYYNSALKDHPTTIAKAHLVVIDGRRANITGATTTINETDGMHFKDLEIEVAADRQYYKVNPAFEKPIRMFAAPITS